MENVVSPLIIKSASVLEMIGPVLSIAVECNVTIPSTTTIHPRIEASSKSAVPATFRVQVSLS